MTWWKRIVGGSPETDRIDYYREALALAEAGSLHEALTSFRLALKESPAPADPEAAEHVRHARDTLAKLMAEAERNVSASESS
jgi:hypothetical protein